MRNKWQILTKGLLKENPVLVLALGICPTLAVTTSATNALGMGLSVIFVLWEFPSVGKEKQNVKNRFFFLAFIIKSS